MAFNNTAGAVHYDTYLTSFATNYYVEQNYLAGRVFPVINVDKQSDKYYVFSAAEENREFDNLIKKWEPLTDPNMFELTQSDDSYFSEEFWAAFYIDKKTAANEDALLRTRERKTRLLMDNMLKKRDRDWISTYLSTSVWGQDIQGVGSSPSTNEFIQWDDSSSTPFNDIWLWKEQFEIRNYGLKPNKIVLSKDIKRHLLQNPQILGKINGGATVANPALVSDAIISALFEVDEVIWADAVSNQANHGEAESAARMVSNRMLMVHSPMDAGIDVASAGAIFAWNEIPEFDFGISARTWTAESDPTLDQKGVAEKTHMHMCYDMRVTGTNLGTYVYDIVG